MVATIVVSIWDQRNFHISLCLGMESRKFIRDIKEDKFPILKRVYVLTIWKEFGQQLYNSYSLDFISDAVGRIQIKVLTLLATEILCFLRQKFKI